MIALSLAGVAVGLVILWANLRTWLKGSRDPKALAPYAVGAGLGSLATICVGGALGWGSHGLAGLLSGAADKGVSTVAGTGAAPVATARMGTLSPEGGVTVCLLLGIAVLMYKAAGKLDRRRLIGGFASFAILGLLPGVAATLSWWPDVINWAGGQGAAALSSGGGVW